MTTKDFIANLFCPVDDKLNETRKNQKHNQANHYPSEVVTIVDWDLLVVLSNILLMVQLLRSLCLPMTVSTRSIGSHRICAFANQGSEMTE